MFCLSIIFLGGRLYRFAKKSELKFFSVDCSIFSVNGPLVFNSNGVLCDFAHDGKVVVGYTHKGKIVLKDKNDIDIWSVDEAVSHEIIFSDDQKNILYISSEKMSFEGQDVRGDCFSKMDINGKRLARWCVSENTERLKELGFKISLRRLRPPLKYLKKKKLYLWKELENEISHANSIFELPENPLAEQNKAFSKGNYLVNLYLPSLALLILDRDMKNILWYSNLSEIVLNNEKLRIHTHDNQLLADGQILTFANSTVKKDTASRAEPDDWHSRLILWNPLTATSRTVYKAKNPRDFRTELYGSVAPAPNGDFLFTDITKDNFVVLIDSNGQEKWRKNIIDSYSQATEHKIHKVRPIYNLDFLKSRNLAIE